MAESKAETDQRFIVEIGSERFDPKRDAAKARRQVVAGKKKLAEALGVEAAKLPGADREAWLVQLAHEPDAETVSRFRDNYGLRLTQRISSFAFVERIQREKAAKIRRDPAVRALIAYRPDLKLQTLRSPESVAGARFEIGFIEGDDLAAVTAILEVLGLNVLLVNDESHAGADSSVLVVTSQPMDLNLVAAIDDVAWITKFGHALPQNFDTSAVVQSGNAKDHPVWDKGLHGEDIIIGVIDVGGIDRSSMFFAESLGPEFGTPEHRKVVRHHSNEPINSTNPHATRVCGCLAADDVNDPGNNPNRGGSWAAKLAYSDSQLFTGEVLLSTMRDELEGAGVAGARVHSNSFILGPEDPADSSLAYDATSAAVDDFVWLTQDHLIVTTAPNPTETGFFGGPMVAKNPITVGGVRAAPNQNKRRTDPRPLTADGRRKPDLLAVADGVITSDLTKGINPLAITNPIGGNSFATPHVAAAAALVHQYFIKGWFPNGKEEGTSRSVTPSGALLKAMLLNATVALLDERSPSERDGWGRLELNRTLHFDGDKLLLWIRDVRRGQGLEKTGATQSYTLKVPADARSMRVTLVFNDRKGNLSSPDPVVNMLDVEVMEPRPSSFGYLGNDFRILGIRQPQSVRRDFTNRLNISADPDELRNNVRQVVVLTPTAGRWKIVVRAHKIDQTIPQAEPGKEPPLRRQGYALVASIALT
jgi:hypothetical protein